MLQKRVAKGTFSRDPHHTEGISDCSRGRAHLVHEVKSKGGRLLLVTIIR